MPTSPKQVEANRRNAQKSTGPRTPEGKAKVSQNAVKHGLYARRLILNTPTVAENPAHYNSLRNAILAEFAHKSPLEHLLAQRIANCVWHMERAEKSPASQFPDIFDPSLNLNDTELLNASRLHYNYLRLKRRLKHRVERTHALLDEVKQSQLTIVRQLLDRAISDAETRCETNPCLERVI